MHRSYPDVLNFIKRIGVFWLWRGFLACPRKVRQASSDSTFIRVEIVLESDSQEQKDITTLWGRRILNTPEICRR